MADIQLVFVRVSCALYGVLSTGIIQEICLYIRSPPGIYVLFNHQFLKFDYENNRWQSLFSSPSLPLVNYLYTYATVEPGQVFIWGDQLKYSMKPYTVEMDGRIGKIPPAEGVRIRPGIIYLHTHMKIYVFGGSRQGTFYLDLKVDTTQCYCLEKKKWKGLPCMPNPREAFNPCLYRDLVYLCGGETTFVETFNPVIQRFQTVSGFVLPIDFKMYGTTTVEYRGKIVVLGFDSMYEWSAEAGLRRIGKHTGCASRSIATPAAYRGFMYVIDSKGACRVFDIRSGSLVSVIGLG